jgi:hypothetical protein
MLMITPETRRFLKLAGAFADPWRTKGKVSLAGPQIDRRKAKWPKLTEARQERITRSAVEILRSGRSSKFEFEGPALAGVRSALCLEGWPFAAAEHTARSVIDRALNILGAVRPTWHQGQTDYTYEGLIHRTRCIRCSGRLPDRLLQYSGGQMSSYCSEACRAAENHGRTRAEWQMQLAARADAYKTFKTIPCAHCDEDFVSGDHRMKYCSMACKVAASRFVKPRNCLACGTEFRPSSTLDGQKFCSRECNYANRPRKERETRSCAACSAIFTPQYPSSSTKACSSECASVLRRRGAMSRSKFTCEEIAQ